uniref:Uncharacterized protein n=1 Tax=Aegilops tauschii subsp. strangulata TaxID=200361 RepID=A0A453KQF4_AEGTS
VSGAYQRSIGIGYGIRYRFASCLKYRCIRGHNLCAAVYYSALISLVYYSNIDLHILHPLQATEHNHS